MMWLDCSDLVAKFPRGHRYREDPALFFREVARVGLSDGRDFGGPGHVRLNLGESGPWMDPPGPPALSNKTLVLMHDSCLPVAYRVQSGAAAGSIGEDGRGGHGGLGNGRLGSPP